ncbi:MAG: hypothetical protein ACP5N1_04775 [Candidatus Woesearchaeota archaeon]
MSLEITLPFGKKNNVKNLVFSILIYEYPLKIIELTNFIRKRYGRTVTFQAVRKAILELLDEGVLIKNNNAFEINKIWLKDTKQTIDKLYSELTSNNITPIKYDSIDGDVSVFTFSSLNELMVFWEQIIDNWFKNFKKGDYNINCWQGAHGWEALMYSDQERKIMSQLKKKGIKSYAVSSGSTPLDRVVWNFFKKAGVKVHMYSSLSKIDREYYVGTYGDIIVQAHYPKEILDLLDKYFKKNKNIENLDLTELSNIINRKIPVKLTIIKNLQMAKQINNSILSQMM